MEEVSLLCETENCGKSAKVFGIKENFKRRSCEAHVCLLVGETAQIYSIEGYSFISTFQDAAVFEERKSLVQKGRGNLTVLKAICDSEHVAALQAIEKVKRSVLMSVEHRFEEMEVLVTEVCNGSMEQLLQLEVEFSQFLTAKTNQLSLTSVLICGEMIPTPRFARFAIADVSDLISTVLSDSWAVAATNIHETLMLFDADQKFRAIENTLQEAAACAQKGISEAMIYAHSLIGDDDAFDANRDSILSELLVAKKNQSENGRKWMDNCWNLRQTHIFSDKAAVEVGQQIASLYYCTIGNFSEAEQLLEKCYQIAEMRNPLSEESMILCNETCRVYFSSGQFEKAEELGKWVLQAFETASLPAEHYWTTLLYTICSMAARHSEISAILKEWRNRGLSRESKLADMLRAFEYVYGSGPMYNAQEAVNRLLKAKRIGTSHFPTSPFTALAIFHLALLSQRDSQEINHRQAQSIYEIADPKSVQCANNLAHLGDFLRNAKKLNDAKECYRQAQSIYQITVPNSVEAAKNLNHLADLLKTMKRWEEAELRYRQAQNVLEVADPMSLLAAENLNSIGALLQQKLRLQEAYDCYQHAQSILRVVNPTSSLAAKSFSTLGDLLCSDREWERADMCYRQAATILQQTQPWLSLPVYREARLVDLYRRAGPQNIRLAQSNLGAASANFAQAADNLIALGNFYMSIKRELESKRCYRQVRSILEATEMKSSLAVTFTDLGDFYCSEENFLEARECYFQAQSILEVIDPKSALVEIKLNDLGKLFISKRDWTEAEICFRRALSIYNSINPIGPPYNYSCFRNFLYLGDECYLYGTLDKAQGYYQECQFMLKFLDPKCTEVASKLYILGERLLETGRFIEAKHCYESVQAILDVADPMSTLAATCLTNLGFLSQLKHQWSEAEGYYNRAQSIYQVIDSTSSLAAFNLFQLSSMYSQMGRGSEMEKYYRQAISLFQNVDSNSISVAIKLIRLGDTFRERWCNIEGEKCYEAALLISKLTYPQDINTTEYLCQIGLMFQSNERWKEAEECYKQAQSNLEGTNYTFVASYFDYLGGVHKHNKRLKDAKRCFKQAKTIYDAANSESVLAADTCCNLGLVQEAIGRNTKAISCYEKAQAISEKNYDKWRKSDATEAIARLKK